MVADRVLTAAFVLLTACSAAARREPTHDSQWPWTWQQSYHPVTPHVARQGDSNGGLIVNGTHHFFTSCTGGWCHLSTPDFVEWDSHGIVTAPPFSLGTGSVVPSPDGDGVLAFFNNVKGHMVSYDGMKTWSAVNTTTTGSPGGRDQARPLQAKDGTWHQMMGCGIPTAAQVCRFKATDPSKLSAWEFDGYLFAAGQTIFGMPVDFYEVPDFFPLTNGDGVRRHVLVVDPWGAQTDGNHVHNVEWHSGTWSDDGSAFATLDGSSGCLDYGWWYAARSVADGSNTGRRLMMGTIASDTTQGPASIQGQVGYGGGSIRFFNSLPRDISLARDGKTVHVRPPPELAGLRQGSPDAWPAQDLTCGHEVVLSNDGNGAASEILVRLNISALEPGAEVGLFVLASSGGEEAVYVGVNSTAVFIDTRHSSQNKTAFNSTCHSSPCFRTVLAAPFTAKPDLGGVLQLRVFVDVTVVEVFASDCVCSNSTVLDTLTSTSTSTSTSSSSPATAMECDCDGPGSERAVAITALAWPLRAATDAGLYARCAGKASSSGASATFQIWSIKENPVHCRPPMCQPPAEVAAAPATAPVALAPPPVVTLPPKCAAHGAPELGQVVYLNSSSSSSEPPRCFTVQHPPSGHDSNTGGPLAVLFYFHGGGGNAADCGGGRPGLQDGKQLKDFMLEYGSFAIVCGEAIQYPGGGAGPPPLEVNGGRWDLPVLPGNATTGNLCENMASDTRDLKYMDRVLDWLRARPDQFDLSRVFTAGCSMGSAFSSFAATCMHGTQGVNITAFATHSTGLKTQGDNVTLPGSPCEGSDCTTWPIVPAKMEPPLKACVFDNVDDVLSGKHFNISVDIDVYKTSVELHTAWQAAGNVAEMHAHQTGGHCGFHDYDTILRCLDDGTSRLLPHHSLSSS